MRSNELRGLCFEADTGQTAKCVDCICWRHLEGRPCRTAQERQQADATDVVIIPVVPSGSGSIKRARKGSVASHNHGNPAGNPPGTAQSSQATSSTPDGADVSPDTSHEALLRACSQAHTALEAAGLHIITDACPKQTPGAKYNAWENRGVGMRLEVGAREVATNTFCLAIHPCLPHLLPIAAQAAAAAAALEAPSAADVARDAGRSGGSSGAHAATGTSRAVAGRPSTRLAGLGLHSLVAACKAVQAARAAEGSQGTAGAATAAAAAVTQIADSEPSLHGQPLKPSSPPQPSSSSAVSAATTGSHTTAAPHAHSWCRKLHLWPAEVAAWRTTEAAVAALLAELAASAAAAAACGVGKEPAAPSYQGAPPALPPPPPLPPPRPCVAHLRHLLQLGRPCYCGRGHVSMQQLQEEVAARHWEATGQRLVGWSQQQQPDRQAKQQEQEQQQQREQQERRGRSGRGGAGSAGEDAAAEEDVAEDEEEEGGGGERVMLLVGNIPAGVRASVVQAELAAAFGPYGCTRVTVSRTRNGGTHGWARLTLGCTDPSEALATAVRELDGKLRLGGAPLSVSPSSGRLDTIFPYLPYAVRCALRVDSTAAFSATDQATADQMSRLLAALSERLLLLPEPTGTGGGEEEEVQRVEKEEEASGGGAGRLLPLTVTDGTACCGGNSLSLAARFQRVNAVELDADRAEDLRHNVALVRAWADFSCRQQQQRQSQQSNPSSSARFPSPPEDDMGGRDASAGSCSTQAAPSSSAGGAWERPFESCTLGCHPLGQLEVQCGDCTALATSLRQDIVFLDPPWGGPQYGNSSSSSEGGATAAATPGAGADAAFRLGDVPLSDLVSELLVCGAAGLVALKLPSRADSELRAMQMRVRQRVAAGLQRGGADAEDSSCEDSSSEAGGCGGGEDRCRASGENGGEEEDCVSPALCGCQPRLLGTEVTLGRSALVVFMLLPYKRSGTTAAASGSSGAACRRCAGLGASFRATLRECCSALGLQYRVICD